MIITSDIKYKVSIIVTTYNREEYILRALNSLLEQSFRSFEVIIVDDGSKDRTAEIVLPVVKENKNFRYISHANRGFPYSFNTGLELCSGEFVTSLDSDDEYSRDHLQNRVNYFKRNKNTDLIHSPADIRGSEKDMYVPDARNKNSLIHLNDCIIGATLFGKKEVFVKLNGYKNIYGQDFEFVKRAKKMFNVKIFEDPTYIYHRNTPNSIINTLKRKKK